ncbi:hypothetical protein HOLleu_39619 [Holothuria leucospilota]|uniref:Uncharacterized protein n=1 Tax=Holothuria leucospilota TaxID=206669 RepID=A0A9Q1BD26_HOLLE|nr:hypothetical protein HOLleu_39619 [Holothuria leucospilota]
MYMHYGRRKNPIVFDGGQRSSGVKKQNFKNSQDRLMSSPEGKKQIFPRIPKIIILSHQMSKCKISQEFPRSNMNLKLFFQHVKIALDQ